MAREPEELDSASVAELAELAGAAMRALATRPEPEAFQSLLSLSEAVGTCIGESARSLAEHGSWSQVAEATGTSKQAAWSRWRLV